MADPRRAPGDDGFSLVEIIVALGIFLVVTMALLPQMVAGIRSVSSADREGVLKGILQQEVDRLRGLPFRVSLGTSGVGTDADVDLLDIYFPNVTTAAPASVTCTGSAGLAVPAASWAGYVGVTTGRRCAYEPPSGVFYRTLTAATDPRLGAITIVRDLQFLSGGTATSPTPAPLTPAATYNSDHATTNYPPAPQVGVTLSVLYVDRGVRKARTTYTQIAQRDVGPTLVRTSVDVDAVSVSSLSPTGASMALDGGVVGLDGTVGDISSATASLAGVVARVATGDPSSSQFGYGATSTTAAPPSVTAIANATDGGVGSCTGLLLCWGSSLAGSDAGTGVVTDGGLPRAGAIDGQLRSAVTDTGATAFTFDNVGSATPTFAFTAPVVRLVGSGPGVPTIADPTTTCPLGANAGARLSGAGFLWTSLHNDSQTLRDTVACGSARSGAIGIMPVDAWAPQGVVKVTLNRAYAWCQVVGGTGTGGAAVDATVQVSDGAGGYQAAAPAASVSLSTPIPGHGTLGQYLQTWSVGAAKVDTAAGSVTTSMPGLVVTTQPTRFVDASATTADQDSAVVVTLGGSTCSSESRS